MTDLKIIDGGDEPKPQLQPGPGQVVTCKLVNLPAKARGLLQPYMVQARVGCKRCHGRGQVGYNPQKRMLIPCGCLVVNLTLLEAAIAAQILQLKQAVTQQQAEELECMEAELQRQPLFETEAQDGPAADSSGADHGEQR